MDERLLRLKAEQKATAEERKQIEEGKRDQAVYVGRMLDGLTDSEGWKHVLESYIEPRLTRKFFLGSRIGRLVWVQGFQSALDGLLEFIQHGKDVRDQILKEEYEAKPAK